MYKCKCVSVGPPDSWIKVALVRFRFVVADLNFHYLIFTGLLLNSPKSSNLHHEHKGKVFTQSVPTECVLTCRSEKKS